MRTADSGALRPPGVRCGLSGLRHVGCAQGCKAADTGLREDLQGGRHDEERDGRKQARLTQRAGGARDRRLAMVGVDLARPEPSVKMPKRITP